jgi:predicted phage terminase large subunit-like protein
MPPHLKLLNRYLMKAAMEPNQRIVVSMPPRHGKSELTSHYFPAWYVGKFPGRQILLLAYADGFAAKWGGLARDEIKMFGKEVFGLTPDKEVDARDSWRAGKPAGQIPGYEKWAKDRPDQMVWSQMHTAGLGGMITGKGAHLLVVDDPIKRPEDVKTDVGRDNMWDWWVSTAYTRLMPGGSAIVVQTRWHEDDLAGRLIEQTKNGEEHWDIINLPALAEDDDPLGRLPGEALWPERYPVERFKQVRITQGPYWFNAQYQGRPTALEGGILKREWMNNRYKEAPRMIRTIQAVDAAFKTGVANDYSAIATWGTDGIDYYLLDCWRERVEFPELKRAITDQFHKWPEASAVYVEDAASGQALIQEMQRNSALPVIGKPVWGDDMQRATAISGLFEAGKIKLPEYATWLADWIEEHAGFPNATHDDTVTTSYYALEELAYLGAPTMVFV